MTALARILTAAAAVVAAVLLVDPPPGEKAPGPSPSPASRPARVFDRPYHGMAVQLHGGAAYVPIFERMIEEVAQLGADTVMLVTHGWQTHGGTCDIHFDAGRNPSLTDLGRLCAKAHSVGLRVVVMPVVLLSAPRNTEWRGQIDPTAGWDEWFQRYTQFILEIAKVCEREDVELLMVGSELIKSEKHTERWRQLIGEVRQFYRGQLGYSANWDHFSTEKIKFWPQLDIVGMTSYYTLASGPKPTLDEVLRRWGPIRRRIEKFHEEVQRPILFTEVGWCSQEGAASEAWNYYHNQVATKEGHEEQLTCYRAFMRTWEGAPCLGGAIWWEWTEAGGEDDFNYTPKGKPAEKLLRQWFHRQRARTAMQAVGAPGALSPAKPVDGASGRGPSPAQGGRP